jgi:osmotically-inducible protein OsmY
MKSNLTGRISRIACATLLVTLGAFAQEHKWAGRELNELEWTIHETLEVAPSRSVFDSLNFEIQGKNVTLSGLVTKEAAKQKAERAVRRVAGVEDVINRIEVLPESKRDDRLRMQLYRAIYENNTLEKYGTRAIPSIHIVVKEGWVTLEGLVDSEADRGAVYRRALKVTPHVTDSLRVAAEETSALGSAQPGSQRRSS